MLVLHRPIEPTPESGHLIYALMSMPPGSEEKPAEVLVVGATA
jgi:hypothetical protein